ncbi:MAG: glutamine--fructose-6-phosphate transaminase (isomerizing) [Clostridiales bacterium]|nr:MAG: glutamine--fructose-6-phosphate transaminase (isomerizing) [Clostridiales bacterium]
MCGIVGYVGKRDVLPVLLGGLQKLEYRGYDSAGVAYIQNGGMHIVKAKGRLVNLREKLGDAMAEDTIGIGHTRWATHGEPSDINAHPHTNTAGDLAVVHNGIIENFAKLKAWLQSKGIHFISETDTEVVAHLVNYFYEGDLKTAVMRAVKMLEGSYALGVMSVREPHRIVAARKDSPLVIGLGKGENLIASDFPALLEYTKDVYLLDDGEIAVISADEVEIYDAYGNRVEKKHFTVDWDVAQAEKGGWEHFMIKEIHEQPRAMHDTLMARMREGRIDLSEINITEQLIQSIRGIHIVACGSAYHAGILGKYVIENIARIPVNVDVASEFRYRMPSPLLSKDDLFIVISQSGETADTIAALREAQSKGAKVIAITNVKGSTISREADFTMHTQAGMEIAVATSKGYLTQVLCLYMIAAEIGRMRGILNETQYAEFVENLKKLPELLEEVLKNKEAVQQLAAQRFMDVNEFFIGRGADYALMMEGSLKLKELSYIHSETYAAGELKHGPIALIEQNTLVMALATQSGLLEKLMSNIKEVKARGAFVVAMTQQRNAALLEKEADLVLALPDIDDLFAPILAAVPYQLYGYYTAVYKGCDVDKPRNLAKSVTVE